MVDILLATYNGGKFLSEQLDSLMNLTYKDIKILIRDDGSNDSTTKIIKEYEKRYSDKIKFIKDDFKAKNAKDNFFTLLKYSTADYIMFCDQDDFWIKDKIDITLKRMLQLECDYGAKTPILVHTDLKVVDKNLDIIDNSFSNYQKLIKRTASFNELLVQNNVTGCTVMINKEVKSYIKDEFNKNILMHDWWLALICASFGKISYIDVSTILYRQHENNTVGAKRSNGVLRVLKSLKNYKIMVNNFKNTVEQSKYFYSIYKCDLGGNNLMVCKSFSFVLNKSIISRIKIYKKYNLFKNTGFKKIAQILIH